MDFAPVSLRLPPLCIHSSLSAFQVDSFLGMLLCEVLDTNLIALDLFLNLSCLFSLFEIFFHLVIGALDGAKDYDGKIDHHVDNTDIHELAPHGRFELFVS